jgi:hypothetical protein
MNELQTEIAELKEFIADLKADRAATKEKEKREAWTKYVSLSVVIIAVIAAIAAQWGGKYSSRVLTQLNDATFNQTLASDQRQHDEPRTQARSASGPEQQGDADGDGQQGKPGGEAAGPKTLQGEL